MLAYVDKYKNTSILGIGLILHRAYMLKDKGKKDRLLSLKEVTMYWAEELWGHSKVPRSHKFFRNFDCIGTKITPLTKTDEKSGARPYTTGPLYVGLRDGLAYCKREGLVKEEGDSFFCTIRGADLHDAWKDIDGWLMDRIQNAS